MFGLGGAFGGNLTVNDLQSDGTPAPLAPGSARTRTRTRPPAVAFLILDLIIEPVCLASMGLGRGGRFILKAFGAFPVIFALMAQLTCGSDSFLSSH